MPRRRSPLRVLTRLLAFTIVLLIFIAWVGDWRRRHNVDTLMNTQAAAYSSLTADAGLLPLNLQPSLPFDPASRLIEGWLSPDEARALRGADEEVMVAWTVPLVRALGSNERAVIYFKGGTFEVRWLSLTQFEGIRAKQEARITSLSKQSTSHVPNHLQLGQFSGLGLRFQKSIRISRVHRARHTGGQFADPFKIRIAFRSRPKFTGQNSQPQQMT